jgi:hypothetical protein
MLARDKRMEGISMKTPTDFRLILVDPNLLRCKAWRRQFKGLPQVKVVNDRFKSLTEFDCRVSAANSFGLNETSVVY